MILQFWKMWLNMWSEQGVRYTIDYGRLNNQEYYSRIVRFTPNLPEPGHLPNGKGSTEASMSTRPVLAPGVCIYK